MSSIKVLQAVCMLLALSPSVGICDGYFRCGSWLVSADTPFAELLKKCGEPSSKKVSVEDVFGSDGRKLGTTRVETWRYDRGPRAAAMIVKVVDGKVESIEGESGDRQPEAR
ncbi:MAG TPA: DUF2845 domain-containing protein [Steroidobacteraceae bacterium]|nr:DUF2845 domain-containing protein [Steroidobacteraceae bacterium]